MLTTHPAGVDSFNVDLAAKRVSVQSASLSAEAVRDAIAKTGKATTLVQAS